MANPNPKNQFKKGVVVNPGGRPARILGLRELFDKYGLVDKAIEVLREEIEHKGKKRVDCAQWICEMQFGKAKQQLDHTTDGKAINLTIIGPQKGILASESNSESK